MLFQFYNELYKWYYNTGKGIFFVFIDFLKGCFYLYQSFLGCLMPDNNFDACNEKSLTKCFPLPKQVFCLKNKPSKFAAASKEKRVDVARAWLFWT